MLNLFFKSPFVRIRSSLDLSQFLKRVINLLLGNYNLLLLLLDHLLLFLREILVLSLLLLSLEFRLLELFQSLVHFTQIFPQCLIFKCEIVDVLSETIHLVYHRFVR